MPGYWNKPSETKSTFGPDGSLYTGDIGYKDDNGWFYVIDRLKSRIRMFDLLQKEGFDRCEWV